MKKNTRKTIRQCAGSLLIFGVICIITSIVISCDEGDPKKFTLPPEGGLVGPITYYEDNTVIDVEVNQEIVYDNDWAFITGELLDENKIYLFGFGDEFWKESGRDSEGPWTERVTYFSTKITLPKKGTYHLKFSNEKSPGVTAPIVVTIAQKIASSLAFVVAGIFSFLGAIVLNIVSKS